MNINATFHDGRVEIEGMEPIMIYGANREIFDRMVAALQENIESDNSSAKKPVQQLKAEIAELISKYSNPEKSAVVDARKVVDDLRQLSAIL